MFKTRSYQSEMLDREDIPRNLLFRNLKELEFINKYLGGHSVSLRGFKKVVRSRSRQYNIADIGCGGGDSLKAISKWGKSKKYNLKLTGIDLKDDCINYAENNCSNSGTIKFVMDDFMNVFKNSVKFDIVHAALFCHHFTEQELILFIRQCNENNSVFIINDLERNPFAYYAIKILTKLFSKSELVKNDAPLSVLRGFKKYEWESILKSGKVKKYVIRNCWAFRHLIIIYPDGS